MKENSPGFRYSRRRFLQRLACTGLAALGANTTLSACARTGPGSPSARSVEPEQAGQQSQEDAPRTHALPTASGEWTLPTPHRGDLPEGRGSVTVLTQLSR
jgi:hypothetical protein